MLDIGKNRTYLMGWAILFVLCYHFLGCTRNFLGDFNIGYVGVDLFLFLSGYGLTKSYQKNKLSVFYERRVKRMFPLYAIVTIILTILNRDKSLLHFIANLSSISFWISNGEYRIDWYLQSLFGLCLLFPLFFRLAAKISNIVICLLVCGIVLYYFKSFYISHWWYACLLGRIPIFMLGIHLYQFAPCVRYLRYFILGGAVLFFPVYMNINQFLGISLLALPIIFILLYFRKCLCEKINALLKFLGLITLELYASNLLVLYMVNTYCHTTKVRVMVYLACQFLISYFFVKINHIIRIKLK